jgi:DNA invertase Pin-like site-specific DNA recombinase
MNTKHSGRFVAYYRVSTARQGRSGLGLEAQRQAVGEHLTDAGRVFVIFTANFDETGTHGPHQRPFWQRLLATPINGGDST